MNKFISGGFMSFGIALAGGGVRGAAHVGVLLALEEAHLKPQAVSGCSSGSIVAGLYALGKSAEELKEIVMDMAERGRYFMDADIKGIMRAVPELLFLQELSLTGILKGNRLEKYLWAVTEGKNINETVMKVVIPAVDINSGLTVAYTNSLTRLKTIEKMVWKSNIPLYEAMRASSSFPAVFQPKKMGEYCLVDGGVTNVLPVDLLAAAGVKNVLAVDISNQYKKPKRDNIFTVATSSFNIMSGSLREMTSLCEKYTLSPELPEDIELLTFDAMEECMEAGYRCAKENMGKIRAVFG